jgi:small multidrug resistance pump
MNTVYIYLAFAILAEVIATTALKASAEFTRVLPSMISIVGYCISLYLLTHVLRTVPLGIAYALWSGLGMVLVTLVGIWVYKQPLDFAAILGMGLIISGVVVINVFSVTMRH